MKRLVKLMAAAIALSFTGSVLAATALSGEDKEFLKNAAEINVTEVQLGKLAQQHGASQAVKQHGAMTAAEHSRANDQLLALAKSKGVDLKAEPAGAQKHMIDTLAKQSGAEFDKEYIEHQAKGHRKAIEMFQKAARDTKDPDVKTFAQTQLPHLESHLAALPQQAGSRTTGIHTEPQLKPGEQPSRRQKTEGAVKVQ